MSSSPPGEGEGYNIISALCVPAGLAQHADNVERPQCHHSCLARPWSCRPGNITNFAGGAWLHVLMCCL